MKVKLCKQTKNIFYTIKKGDTYQNIADYFCIPLENLMQDNDNVELYEDMILYIKERNRCIHIVKPGETTIDICKKYNISKDCLSNINKEFLFIGQKLYIPFDE